MNFFEALGYIVAFGVVWFFLPRTTAAIALLIIGSHTLGIFPPGWGKETVGVALVEALCIVAVILGIVLDVALVAYFSRET